MFVLIKVTLKICFKQESDFVFLQENCLPKNQSSSLHSENVKGKEEDSKNSILADRLGKLDAAKDGWKKRIQPSDAVRFSVEGKKLGKMDSSSPPSVSLQIPGRRTEREKRSPKARKFRSKQCNAALNSMPSSPLEKQGNPITR